MTRTYKEQQFEEVVFGDSNIGNLFNVQTLKPMLYLLRNLRTTITFSPSEINQVGELKIVWSKLRQKIIGKLTNEHGLIIHINHAEMDGKQKTSLAKLNNNGTCTMDVQFSAIGFKVAKNDLVYCKVRQLSVDCITGFVNSIEVKIPRAKIDPQMEYDKVQHCFRMKGRNYKIEVGDRVLCKCFESRIEAGSSMQVIGELTTYLIELNIDRQ